MIDDAVVAAGVAAAPECHCLPASTKALFTSIYQSVGKDHAFFSTWLCCTATIKAVIPPCPYFRYHNKAARFTTGEVAPSMANKALQFTTHVHNI